MAAGFSAGGGPFAGALLVSDMDGTLLTAQFEIPEANLAAIARFTAGGGLFTVATGRSVEAVRPYVVRAGVNLPAIAFNGAALYDFGREETVWQAVLPDSCHEVLGRVMERFPTVGAELHAERRLFCVRKSPEGIRHILNESLRYEETVPENVPFNKILFAADHETLLEVERFVENIPHEGMYFIFTSPVYFEMVPAGANKGTALSRLAAMYHIDHDHTYAIGDYYNDVDLIQAAGVGALVKTAPAELQSLADYTAADCKSGAVADFIRWIERQKRP